MNIGVSTYHSTHNYGAMLQAYGLQQAIRSLGHEATFIHYHPDGVVNNNRRRRPIKSASDFGRRLAFLAFQAPLRRRYERFEHFRETYINVTDRYRTVEELFERPPLFDAYVCGSDQIWNVENRLSEIFFLQFVPEGRPRIAYAPSFGTATIPDQYHEPIGSLLQKFHALSAREVSGQAIIEKVSGRVAELVLDPTLLHSRDVWSTVAMKPRMTEPYIAFYSLEVGPKVSEFVARVSKILRLPVVVLGKAGGFIFRGKTVIRIDGGPAEFLGWIMDASFVITNSFHGTVFALIFETPFITLPHSSRSTRTENLLNLIGSQERMAAGGRFQVSDDLLRLPVEERDRIRVRIAEMRESSLRYLESSLSAGRGGPPF